MKKLSETHTKKLHVKRLQIGETGGHLRLLIYFRSFINPDLHSQKKLFFRSIIIEFETPVGFMEKEVVVCIFIDVARTQKTSIGNL